MENIFAESEGDVVFELCFSDIRLSILERCIDCSALFDIVQFSFNSVVNSIKEFT